MSIIFNQIDCIQFSAICADRISSAIDEVNYFELPFKHIILDNFFDDALAQICLLNFPSLDNPTWEHSNDTDIEVKYRTTWKSEFDIPEGIVTAVRLLNSAPLLKAIGDRFGIPKLIPDPYFSGGGLNVTTTGGVLDVHIDGNYHDATGLHRRMNAILYLNSNWRPSWGGEFGLYDATGHNCLKKVAPLFNRLIIFDSHDKSFHGLPEPLKFPDVETRKSLILYYYTKEPRPSEQVVVDAPHSALWVKRNIFDKRGSKTRKFS